MTNKNSIMWQIAQALGIHEMTFSKWFRNELPKERQKEVMAAVAEIKKKRIESEEIPHGF